MPAASADADVVRLAARAHEQDRYLSALLAPRPVRGDLIALAAFAGEIARVPGYVSEPMLGEIRLQWWRDTLETQSAAAVSCGNPIADAVAATMRTRSLALATLEACIDGYARRLDDTPFADTAALLANLDATEGNLFALALRIAGGETGPVLDAARAFGLARLLLELPVTLAQGKVLLPLDRLAAHALDPGTLRKDEAGGRLAPVVAELAGLARSHTDNLARHWHEASLAIRAALRPVALVRPYLELSQRRSGSLFEVRDIAPLTRVWRLWRGGYRGGI